MCCRHWDELGKGKGRNKRELVRGWVGRDVNLVGRAGEVVRLGGVAWMQLKPGHGG